MQASSINEPVRSLQPADHCLVFCTRTTPKASCIPTRPAAQWRSSPGAH